MGQRIETQYPKKRKPLKRKTFQRLVFIQPTLLFEHINKLNHLSGTVKKACRLPYSFCSEASIKYANYICCFLISYLFYAGIQLKNQLDFAA